MKKMNRVILFVLALSMLVSCSTLSSHAQTAQDDAVSPYWLNGNECTLDFVVSSTGLAVAEISYLGIPDVTVVVRTEIYIEKRVLGIFWERVDIGTADNVWYDQSSALSDIFCHSVQVSDRGTYRATFKVKFAGTAGEPDIVTETITDTY